MNDLRSPYSDGRLRIVKIASRGRSMEWWFRWLGRCLWIRAHLDLGSSGFGLIGVQTGSAERTPGLIGLGFEKVG